MYSAFTSYLWTDNSNSSPVTVVGHASLDAIAYTCVFSTGIYGAIGFSGATGQSATGSPGAAGPHGVTGATGYTGSLGPAGRQGVDGPVGAQGPAGGAMFVYCIHVCTGVFCNADEI